MLSKLMIFVTSIRIGRRPCWASDHRRCSYVRHSKAWISVRPSVASNTDHCLSCPVSLAGICVRTDYVGYIERGIPRNSSRPNISSGQSPNPSGTVRSRQPTDTDNIAFRNSVHHSLGPPFSSAESWLALSIGSPCKASEIQTHSTIFSARFVKNEVDQIILSIGVQILTKIASEVGRLRWGFNLSSLSPCQLEPEPWAYRLLKRDQIFFHVCLVLMAQKLARRSC